MGEISKARYRAGQGEPLVLLHGFTATWRCWLPVMGELVPHFDVLAPTLDGHDGGAESPPDDPARSIGEAAQRLAGRLDEEGIETAHLAGNSMGGALALELAKMGRARSVVAISPGGGWEADDTREPERIIRWFKTNQKLARATLPRIRELMSRPRIRQIALRDVMTRGHQVPAGEAVELIESSVRCSVVDDVYETIRSGTGRVVDLDEIDCPVRIAWGDHDRILPLERHSNRFRTQIRGADFRVLRGVGHTPMWDDPHLVATTIGDFAAAAAAA